MVGERSFTPASRSSCIGSITIPPLQRTQGWGTHLVRKWNREVKSLGHPPVIFSLLKRVAPAVPSPTLAKRARMEHPPVRNSNREIKSLGHPLSVTSGL